MIGHNNEGMRAGWFLDSIQIVVPVSGKHYMFPSHRWLCKDEADGKTEVEIYPSEILDIEQRRQLVHFHTVSGKTCFVYSNRVKIFIDLDWIFLLCSDIQNIIINYEYTKAHICTHADTTGVCSFLLPSY